MTSSVCLAFLATALALIHVTSAHSLMTKPEGISGSSCRMGGDPKFGVKKCPGPCDFTKIEGPERSERPWANFYPPDKPAATYERGQKVTIYYTRNNHLNGGFTRLSLVPLDKMKDKAVHSANAFHYSCWGANVKVASESELGKDKYGFSLIGSDGKEHDQAPAYYTVDIKIPEVVPDGKYMLGWAWFGGPGGKILQNAPQEPKPYSYFSDYWSCSFVVIKGGAPLASSYTPVFVNDMSQFSEDGCMSHADDVGQCTYEPCRDRKAFYRKPAAFLGDSPTPITPANFGGSAPPPAADPPRASPPPKEDPPRASPPPKEDPTVEPPKESPSPKASPSPMETPTEEYPPPETPKTDPPADKYPPPTADPPQEKGYFDPALMSCLCIVGSSYGCFTELAAYSNKCTARTRYYQQTRTCRESCCALCKETGDKFSACRHRYTRRVCASS